MQERLVEAGKEVTGSIIIDEACHMLRTGRDLRSRKEQVDSADYLLVLSCGAGIQAVAEAADRKTVAGTNSKFLGNIKRFGQFEQRCSLCGDCRLNETSGICPVTLCAKGLLNGPCGGMQEGACEVDSSRPCAWVTIYERRQHTATGDEPLPCSQDFFPMNHPGNLVVGK